MLTSAVNVSEGRRPDVVDAIASAAGAALLDVHQDPDHNRAVLTVAGDDAPRAVAAAAVDRLDLGAHAGVHPRIGVVDVVPFVPLGGSTMADAISARDAFAGWAATALGVPCFLYGPERTLPDIRRRAFRDLVPDFGPSAPHPTAGACAVGARDVLVAYNLWLRDHDMERARAIASGLRSNEVRALALEVGGAAQISLNLVDPLAFGPADAFDAVAAHAALERAELVGLVPRAVLDRIDPARWDELDVGAERTLEARLAAAGLS